jgi:hypothetical protein
VVTQDDKQSHRTEDYEDVKWKCLSSRYPIFKFKPIMIWGAYPHSPPPPTLVASFEIAESQPNHTICQTFLLSTTDRNCRPTCHKFQPQGGKRVHTVSWHLLVLWQNLRPVAPHQKNPHTTPYHSLIYISTYHFSNL